ncbi:MAG: iron-containing alcohol dehydrogenase [Lachnospiraceae bacterium]|nr:iron-containing alcohol dehydrogenase [Lachnospiraceae bacterium]
MDKQFLYSQPVKIRFGTGSFQELGAVLKEVGAKKAVLVSAKYFEPEALAFQEQHPEIVGIYPDVEPNPQLYGAVEVALLARKTGADAVIGVGGGSVIDTAKFAAAIAPGEGLPYAYYRGLTPFPDKPLTIIAVPTTAGTGSEVTQVSVISCGEEKRTINHPVFMPKAAVVDPLLTLSVPPYTTMITGLDAMAHALEGFWSKNHQPIPDLFAAEAVKTVLENLEKAYRDGSDVEARTNMSYAALLGGLSFALPKTAGCHACSYPLSELFHLPHGEACAFTLDSFVEINDDERLEAFCRRIGLQNASELAERIRYFKKLAGLKTRLRDLSGNADAGVLAKASAVHPLMGNNPVPLTETELKKLFEKLN